jgi:hypothetical protein
MKSAARLGESAATMQALYADALTEGTLRQAHDAAG